MGAALAKSMKNKQRTSALAPLAFYETSLEDWAFGKEHVVAIQDLLGCLKLQMMADIIFEYLGESKDINSYKSIEWNHFNYTTFIHTKNTPLDDRYKPQQLREQSYDRCQSNIVILGSRGVGKTALTTRFVANMFVEGEYDPTTSDNYRRQVALDVEKNEYDGRASESGSDCVVLDILDDDMRETFPSMRDCWIKEGQIFLLVFDVVNPNTFDEITLIREQIVRVKDKDNYPVITVGNKCDLRVDGACSGVGVDMNAVHDWCKEHQIPYFEASAKKGKNVNSMFRHCVYEYRMWLKRQ